VSLVATDGQHVYWASGTHIERAHIGVDAGTELVLDASGFVNMLALTTNYVVYARDGLLLARPKIAPESAPNDYGSGWFPPIAAGDDDVVGPGSSALYFVTPPQSGYTSLIAASDITAVAVSGKLAALVGTRTAAKGPELLIVPLAPTPQPTALPVDHVRRVAIDGQTVFFTDDQETVSSIDTDGKNLRVLAPKQPTLAGGDIVASHGYVYFTTSQGIRRVPKAGGCIDVISDVPAASIAVTASYAYYHDGMRVLGVPLPP
jgi:hypothetical protein